jgi:hypothetical protein
MLSNMSVGGDRDGPDRRLQVRAALEEWFPAVALVALALAAAGGYAAYTAHAAPGTTVEERQVSTWEGNGSYATSARVTEPNPLYPTGRTLEDRPAYFRTVSPRLDGTFAFEYAASDGGAVDVTVDQRLVVRSVSGSSTGDPTVVYWRIEEPLGATSATDVDPDQPVTATFSRNVSQVAERVANVSDRLGGSPGTTQILVVSSVDVEGRVNGRAVDRTAAYRLPIEVGGATFSPGGTVGSAMSGSAVERVTRPRTYGPLWRIGGPAATVAGLLGLAALAFGRREGYVALSPAESARLDLQSTRAEFDDWITTARLPSAVEERPRVAVESLAGLVDTAIDVDARVFERPDGTAYTVLHDGLRYVYEPPVGARNRPAGVAATDPETTGPDGDVDGGAADGRGAESGDDGANEDGDLQVTPDDQDQTRED